MERIVEIPVSDFETLGSDQRAALTRFINVMPYLFDTGLSVLQKEIAEEEHREAAQACMDLGLTKQICEVRDGFNEILVKQKTAA